VVIKKGKRERGICRGMHKENVPQNHGLGKQEGLNFVSSCNQGGLKPGVLNVSVLGWDRAWRALPCSWREGR